MAERRNTVSARSTRLRTFRRGWSFALGAACSALLLVFTAWPELPSCQVLSGTKGGPAIKINDRVFSPIFFAGNNQFNRDNILLDEVRQAAKAGIDLISFNIPLDWNDSKHDALKTIDQFCSANRRAYYYVRIWVGGTPAWLDAHPDACIVLGDGTRVRWASPASTLWRDEAERLLRARLGEIIEGPHADRFLGVCLANMQTGEWFYYHANDSLDYSEANERAFRAWLTSKYETDRDLQTAWGNADATLAKARLPEPEEMNHAVFGPFRDPVADRPASDAQQFQSDLVADTIAHFASVVKEVTDGRSLVGAFYGYTFELNHNGPQVLAQSGHLALARLLDCPDLDMIHAPYAYFERKIGEPGQFHLPVDSIALHGKLAVLEEDTYTHHAIPPPEGLIAPGANVRTRSLEETLAVNRRNYANFLTHKAGFWYFDLLSDGRWLDEEFWKTTPLLRRMAATARNEPVFHPEVAFVVDETSVSALRADTRPYLLQSLGNWRHEVSRIGTTVGFYLQSDLPEIPDSVKVVILANPYCFDDSAQRAVRSMLRRGTTVIWTFAPGLIGPEGLNVSRIEDLTGFEVTPLQQEGPFAIASTVTKERVKFDHDWSPRFRVGEAGGMQILARYEGAEEAAVAARPMGGGVSVYTSVPRLPVGLLRWICRNSGVNFYRESPGMVGVIGPYLVVHTNRALTERFRWPEPVHLVERLIPYRETPVATDTQVWRDDLPKNSTVIYRITR